jgi:phospholipase D
MKNKIPFKRYKHLIVAYTVLFTALLLLIFNAAPVLHVMLITGANTQLAKNVLTSPEVDRHVSKYNGAAAIAADAAVTASATAAATASTAAATNATTTPIYEACFTPEQACTEKVVNVINQAKNKILVQAFYVTERRIIDALVNARWRGATVEVLLDKIQLRMKKSRLQHMINNGVVIKIDYKPEIAHSKVIIADDSTIVTGSFNFTHSAETKNTENLLVIHDKQIAKRYAENWYNREKESVFIKDLPAK